MILTVRDIQSIQQLLRNVAEVDPDDVIANRASQLTVELEYVKTPFDYNTLNEQEQESVRYAISKKNVYILRADARHAENTLLNKLIG